ncbi:hypothetical protein EVAR_22813_1 [Eumeta japonica]|uniref:Uncharacterized protein n=1 Tax=Eumeta variegata TaxID=151549 RepID=A0A4C1VFE5_EUMVA|nr:hypothetical protein EVAR_22813_1 [Eumeta japonica]
MCRKCIALCHLRITRFRLENKRYDQFVVAFREVYALLVVTAHSAAPALGGGEFRAMALSLLAGISRMPRGSAALAYAGRVFSCCRSDRRTRWKLASRA